MINYQWGNQTKKETDLPKFLSAYQDSDYLSQVKAVFFYKIMIAMAIFIVLLIAATTYLQVYLLDGINPFVITVIALSLLSLFFSAYLLKIGKLNTSMHSILIMLLSAIWIIMFSAKENNLNKFDTISLTFGLLTLTPLLLNKNRINIIIYTGTNILLLTVFTFFTIDNSEVRFGLLFDYYLDNTISFVLVATVAYNIFVIYQKSIMRSEDALTKAHQAEHAVQLLNEELESKVELRTKELNDALQVIEVSNYELKLLNENLSEESQKLVDLNEMLFDSEQKLRIANDTKDLFFSIIAHDLKNPFVALINNSELLEQHYEKMSDIERIKIISNLKKASINTHTLLENLLVWSRSQMGNMEFSPYNFNLNDLLIKIKLYLQAQAETKNIELTINLPDDYQLFADEDMLNTIIRNLATNAIKFTPRDGAVEFGLDLKNSRHCDCLYVKDNGIGIDPEVIPKLFQLDKKVFRPGTEGELSTGLGLVLCKEFVERHGGEIWAESKLGEGTTFYFTLACQKFENNEVHFRQ